MLKGSLKIQCKCYCRLRRDSDFPTWEEWELLGLNPAETELSPSEAFLKYFVHISLQISLFPSFLSPCLEALVKWSNQKAQVMACSTIPAPASSPAWIHSQHAGFRPGFLCSFFFIFILFYFIFVCRISRFISKSRNRAVDAPGCLSPFATTPLSVRVAGCPRAKMESTWLCNFTIEIKESNMTEEACCLWNYGFQWRTFLPNHN